MKHGGDIYSEGLLKGRKLLDFSSNINPLGVPKGFIENINEGIEMLQVYPDIKYRKLKDNIINYLNKCSYYFGGETNEVKLTHENILLGNGASEIIDLAISYFKSITIVVPSFVEYEDNSNKHNLKINYSYLKKDFTYDYEDIVNKLNYSEGLIIGNPNNPNGSIIDKEKFIRVLEFCEENNKIVLIDEAFIEFTGSFNYSLLNLVERYKCLFIIKAITKFYGLPGVRLGFGITKNKKIIDYIVSMQNPWNINCFAELSAKYALNDEKYIKDSLNWIKSERKYMIEELNKISIIEKCHNSYGNYLLCELKGINCDELYSRLEERHILIRKCNNYRGLDDRFVRFAIKDRSSNEKLIESLKNINF
ncbi:MULTISPECIES: histidinol-phosphate transaminase [Clostridium]|uniref:Aminotransferase class I/II-fold pyridoxal phosphate-dependent enzyme n=1 Tax=Clostridium faecium TaxID=2762223 RepID=A0ABR8YSU8_9CLOT|nr:MULTISPECIES: histidinol-phosphate transaminase [Clostridium]MBD8047340.1 aminotransferase class I/II-fold pyridoxal phosphate-dependent enzyme [Clostridium faecium]MDU1350280.1 histidinol-phosphate transaminase [Clostridium argentinense]